VREGTPGSRSREGWRGEQGKARRIGRVLNLNEGGRHDD